MTSAIALVLAIIFVLTCFTACSKKPDETLDDGVTPPTDAAVQPADGQSQTTPTVDPQDTQTEPEPVTEPEPEQYTGPRNPLTNLPCEKDYTGKRPFAIMINNISIALPQVGVSKADIIFELPVEGGITRMMALYQDMSDAGTVGSVRSSRHYFLDIAQAFDAVYIHAGGSNQAYLAIKNRGINNIDGVNSSPEMFFRDAARRSSMGYEHSLMMDTSLLDGVLSKKSIRTDLNSANTIPFAFSDELDMTGGETATTVTVRFSSSKRTSALYDEAEGVYKLTQNGANYIDGATSEQLAVTNVIVLYADFWQIAGDTAGRLDAKLTGSGEGYFACGGKYVPITWSKASTSDQFVLKLKDGSPLTIKSGKTYFAITDIGKEVYLGE